MAGRTVAAHIPDHYADRLTKVVDEDGRAVSQVVATAIKLVVDMTPAGRRAVTALDSMTDLERDFVTRAIGRAAMKARERVAVSRMPSEYLPLTNRVLDNDEDIEAEAAAACRR